MKNKISQFEMCKKTKKKALELAIYILKDIELSCYLIALDKTKKLNKMLERHRKKELK